MIRHIASIPTLLALLLGACSPGTDPGPCQSVECLENIGRLVVHSYRHHLGDSSYGETAASASFVQWAGPYMGFGVKPGRVRLNETWLVFDDDHFEYRLPDSTMPLRTAPALNIWSISGSRDVPTFVDTVSIPALRPTLLAPRPGDTISIAEGMRLQWRGISGDPGPYQLSVVRAGESNGPRTFLIDDLLDSGSISYPLADKEFRPGPTSVSLIHMRSHFTRISEGLRITSTVVLVERITVVLVE